MYEKSNELTFKTFLQHLSLRDVAGLMSDALILARSPDFANDFYTTVRGTRRTPAWSLCLRPCVSSNSLCVPYVRMLSFSWSIGTLFSSPALAQALDLVHLVFRGQYNYIGWRSILPELTQIGQLLMDNQNCHKPYLDFMEALSRRDLAALGWVPSAGEDHQASLLRETLLSTAVSLGFENVTREYAIE